MALRGAVRAVCPQGCELMDIEIWSFIRGDTDAALRENLLGGELNLILCEDCGAAFYPEATVVYYDPPEELLAFIFPESYRKEAELWRRKMHEDVEQMRGMLAAESPGGGRRGPRMVPVEPLIFFGMEGVRAMLRAEDDLADELRIAEFMAPGLGLSRYPVERGYARSRELPRMLPFVARGKSRKFTREGAVNGLRALLGANNRLAGFNRWLKALVSGEAPPRSKTRRIAHPAGAGRTKRRR